MKKVILIINNAIDSRWILKLEGDDNNSAIEKYYSIYTIKAPF